MTRTSKHTAKYTAWGLLATLAATVAGPVLADQQSDKNNMRNLAIAGAAVAGYGLLNHNNAATLLGAAGAVIAGSQYEKDRQQQSQDNGWYGDRRYHRADNNGYRSGGTYRVGEGRYDNGSYNNGSYNNGSYNNGGVQWRNDYNSNRDYNSRSDGWNADTRHDNGRRLGWTKNHDQDGSDRH